MFDGMEFLSPISNNLRTFGNCAVDLSSKTIIEGTVVLCILTGAQVSGALGRCSTVHDLIQKQPSPVKQILAECITAMALMSHPNQVKWFTNVIVYHMHSLIKH